MDLKEAIYTRRAVREYTTEPISENVIRELIDAAVQAPSAVNAQPCSFCVVRDKAVLRDNIAGSKSAYGENDAGRTHVASFQRDIERSEFRRFLSRASANRDFHRG
jgi:nitroreductase